MLTHSDDQFYEIFKPNLDEKSQLFLEEDKLKIEWYPSYAEKWLNHEGLSSFHHRIIEIDSYEATIFPAERVENTKRLKAHVNQKSKGVSLSAENLVISDDIVYR